MSLPNHKSNTQSGVDWLLRLMFFTFTLYPTNGLRSDETGIQPLLHRIIRSPQQHKMCIVSQISVQRNFDINRFMGRWYDVARIKKDDEEFSPTSAVSEYQLDSEGRVVIRYTGVIDGKCTAPVNVVAQQDTLTNSKLTIEPQNLEGKFFLNGSYWIIETNYDYALIYGCTMLRHDGACMEGNELVYVISRAPVLSTVMLSRVLFIVTHRLCVNISQLAIDLHTESCPLEASDADQSYKGTTLSSDGETEALEQPQIQSTVPGYDHSTDGSTLLIQHQSQNVEHSNHLDQSFDKKPSHISDQKSNEISDNHFNKVTDKPTTQIPHDEFNRIHNKSNQVHDSYNHIPDQSNQTHDQYHQIHDQSNQIHDQSNQIHDHKSPPISDHEDNSLSEDQFEQFKKQQEYEVLDNTIKPNNPDEQQDLDWTQKNEDILEHQHLSNQPSTTGLSSPPLMPRDEEVLVLPDVKEVDGRYDIDIELSVTPDLDTDGNSEVQKRFVDSTTTASTTSNILDDAYILNPSVKEEDLQQLSTTTNQYSEVMDPGCDFNALPAQEPYDERLLLGSWLVVGALKGDLPYSSARLLIVRLATDSSILIFHYTGSTSGVCVGTRRLLAQQIRGGVYEMSSLTGPTGQVKIIYMDASQAVMHYCPAADDSSKCLSSSPLVLLLTRGAAPQHIPPAWVSGLGACGQAASSLQLIRHSDNCQIRATSQISLIRVAANFKMEQLMGTWYSVLQYGQKNPTDTLILRFHKDRDYHHTIGTSTGIRNQVCQTAINFTLEDHGRAEWKPILLGQQVWVKVLWLDDNYMIWFECRAEDRFGECAPGSLTLSVLHKQPPALGETFVFSDVIKRLPLHILLGTGLQLQDFGVSHHLGSCPMPKIRKDVCRFDEIPVASDIDYNQLGGVWHSLLILKGSRYLQYTTAILQPTRSRSFLAIFRTFRELNCLPADTTVLSPLEGLAGTGSFQFKVRGRKSLLKILYTDYDYTLIYECADEIEGNFCPYPQAVLYGRVRDETVPESVLRTIFDSVSDLSCLYYDDFIPAVSPDNCSLPYSGRRSCRLDDILIHESFEEREMLGTWQLLTRSQNASAAAEGRNGGTAETIRLSLDSAEGISYSSSAQLPSGECSSVRGSISAVTGANATYSIDSQFRRLDIFKVLFMNAQYMVVYVCKNYYSLSSGILSEGSASLSTCPSHLQEVKVYGRSTIMSTSVQRMLTDITTPKTCVSLNHLVDASLNNKCDLPDGCTVQDYIIQEHFNISMMEGTWQLLMKSRFRLSDAHPTTIKFRVDKPSGRNNIEAVVVQDTGNGSCSSERVRLEPASLYYSHMTKEGTFVMRHLDNRQQQLASFIQILWTDASYIVSLMCMGGVSETGACPADRAELMVWGRAWMMTSEERKKVLQEARDRTLRCYAVTSMVDVTANDACSMPASECTMDQFKLHPAVNRDEMLGLWHLAAYMRSPESPDEVTRSRDVMRVALSGDTYHFTVTSHITKSTEDLLEARETCRSVSGTATRYQDLNSTFSTTRYTAGGPPEQAITQVIHLSSTHLVLLECTDSLSVYTSCRHHGVTVWTRADEAMSSEVLKVTLTQLLLNTHSCVATHSVVSTTSNSGNEKCEGRKPEEGSELCGYRSFGSELGVEPLIDQMSGLWFEQMRSTRVQDLNSEAGVIHARISGDVLTLSGAFHDRYRCISYSNDAHLVSTDSMIWSFQSPDVNATVKVLDIGAEHMIIYGCQSGAVSDGESFICSYGNEHLTVYSRKRFISSEERDRLRNLVQHNTCFSISEIVTSQHYEKCDIPTILEYGNTANKPCKVDDYPVAAEFDFNLFSGIWYEIERLRATYHNLWEAGVLKFSVHPPSTLLLSHAGSRYDRCYGPVHAYTQSVRSMDREGQADFTLWLGDMSLHGNPWTASISSRLKIVWTDNDRAALVYVCHGTSDNGTCRPETQQLYVLSRNKRLDADVRQNIYDVITRHMCVDVHDLVTTQHNEADCLRYVDPVAAEARVNTKALDGVDQSQQTTADERAQPAEHHSSTLWEAETSSSTQSYTRAHHQTSTISEANTLATKPYTTDSWMESTPSLTHGPDEVTSATTPITDIPLTLDGLSTSSNEQALVDVLKARRDSVESILPSEHQPSYEHLVETETFDFEHEYENPLLYKHHQNLNPEAEKQSSQNPLDINQNNRYYQNQERQSQYDQNSDNQDQHPQSEYNADEHIKPAESHNNAYYENQNKEDNHHQKPHSKDHYEQAEYNENQYKQVQYNQEQYNRDQHNQDQYIKDEMNRNQLNQEKFNRDQYNTDQHHRNQYELEPYYHNEHRQIETGEQLPIMDEGVNHLDEAAEIKHNDNLHENPGTTHASGVSHSSLELLEAPTTTPMTSTATTHPATTHSPITTTTIEIQTTIFDRLMCPIPMCSRNCLIATDERGCEICDCSSPTHDLPPPPPLKQPPPASDVEELISFHPNTDVVQEVNPIVEDVADSIDFTSHDSSLLESEDNTKLGMKNSSFTSEVRREDSSHRLLKDDR